MRSAGRCSRPSADSQLAAYGAAVPRLAAAAAEKWSDGQMVDVSAAMDELALAVVTETLLGADAAPLAADLRVLSTRGPLLAAPLGRVLERLRVPPFRAAGRAADRLRVRHARPRHLGGARR